MFGLKNKNNPEEWKIKNISKEIILGSRARRCRARSIGIALGYASIEARVSSNSNRVYDALRTVGVGTSATNTMNGSSRFL